jgi:hypothetical protein
MAKPRTATKLTDISETVKTAYHEAGHAVVAIALRLPFCKVTIEPSDNAKGFVLIRAYRPQKRFGFRPPKWQDDARKRIAVSMAGFAAMARLEGSLDDTLSAHDRAWNAPILASVSGTLLDQHDLATHAESCGSACDWEDIEEEMAFLVSATKTDWVREYHKQTKRVFRILSDPGWWAGVVALARVLLKETTVADRKVRKIVMEARQKWLFGTEETK